MQYIKFLDMFLYHKICYKYTLGKVMLTILIDSLGNTMDIPKFCAIQHIVVSFLITVGVSLAVNLLCSKRIRTMDMVMEIKATE